MLSLVIILVSGLFVGMVLGLQGYDTLSALRFVRSARRARGLSLVRELGPVVAGAAVRQPRGQRHHRGDRPDEGDRAALCDGDDGRRPDRPGRRARVSGAG